MIFEAKVGKSGVVWQIRRFGLCLKNGFLFKNKF
jgi:hypothetical protein